MAPDAAALPSPPNFAPGDTLGRRDLHGMVSSGGRQNGLSPRFPNIKDLQDEAAALELNDATSVCRLRSPM